MPRKVVKKAGARRVLRATARKPLQALPKPLYETGFGSSQGNVARMPSANGNAGRANEFMSPKVNWTALAAPAFEALPITQPAVDDEPAVPSKPWFNERMEWNANVTVKWDIIFGPPAPSQEHASKETEKALFDKLAHRYQKIKKLGAGANGSAYLVRKLRGSKQIVLKVTFDIGNAYEAYQQEALALKRLKRFDNVLGYISHEELNGHFLLFTDYCRRGDLFDWVRKSRKDSAECEAKRILFECALSLAACEKDGIIHGDVKPENFFLDTYGQVKLADFGLSILQPTVSQLQYDIQTMFYRAPEVEFLVKPDISTKVDSYSFGKMILVVLTGCLIDFDGERGLVEEIEKKLFGRQISDDLKDLLANTLCFDTERRLSAFEIVQHDYFKEIRCRTEYARTLRQLARRR
jgi:hypothetical protein